MSTKNRIQAALAAKKARLKPVAASPSPVGSASPPKENPLLGISRNMVSRMPEGREAILARQAIAQWKGSRALQDRYPSVADYFDILSELAAAGKIQIKEAFMTTEKIGGADYGLSMHAKWVEAGRPGTFTAFLEAERKREAEEGKEHTKAAGGGR